MLIYAKRVPSAGSCFEGSATYMHKCRYLYILPPRLLWLMKPALWPNHSSGRPAVVRCASLSSALNCCWENIYVYTSHILWTITRVKQIVNQSTYVHTYISIKVNVAFYSLEISWFNELSENPVSLCFLIVSPNWAGTDNEARSDYTRQQYCFLGIIEAKSCLISFILFILNYFQFIYFHILQ